MSDVEKPKIEFPCPDYPIKVMGENTAAYREAVLMVMQKHAAGFDEQKITVRDSRNGNYQSITVFIEATGKKQLTAIFEDLKKHPSTRMVL